MPFDGSGTYSPPSAPTFPAVAGTTITASYFNAIINDIATALSNCLTRDNQGKPSANISWNSKNLSGVAALTTQTLAATTSITTVDEAYGVGWSANLTVPTKNALYNQFVAVNAAISSAVAGLMDLKGNIDCSANPNYPVGLVGDTYYVSVAGKIGGASGTTVEVGDAIVCKTDNAGGTQAAVGASWFILEHNLQGALMASNNLSDVANAATARTNLAAAGSGAITGSGLTIATAKLAGRSTASTGAIEEIGVGAGLSLTAGTLALSFAAITFNNSGAGVASGTTADGSATRVISWNTVGAAPRTPALQTNMAATVTPTFSDDIVDILALNTNLTIANPTGTAIPNFGQVIRIRDNGTARTISFGAQYRAVGVTLPTTTTINKLLYIAAVYNSTDTKWDVVAVNQE